MDDGTEAVLHGVGPRLRALRQRREVTLAELSATTGISVSTLSRLESGQRRATLELLLRWPGRTRCPWTTSSGPRRRVIRGCTCAR